MDRGAWRATARGVAQSRTRPCDQAQQLYNMRFSRLPSSKFRSKGSLGLSWAQHVPVRKKFSQLLFQPSLTFLSFRVLEQAISRLAVVGSLKFYELTFDTGCPFSRTSNLFHIITFYNTFTPNKARLPKKDRNGFPETQKRCPSFTSPFCMFPPSPAQAGPFFQVDLSCKFFVQRIHACLWEFSANT